MVEKVEDLYFCLCKAQKNYVHLVAFINKPELIFPMDKHVEARECEDQELNTYSATLMLQHLGAICRSLSCWLTQATASEVRGHKSI